MQKNSWKASANLSTLRARAELNRNIRSYFDQQKILEVETPLLSQHATVDRHIESFSSENRWLHTSPEFAMKRLLCEGFGAIWQLCKVFRLEEAGKFHAPEFSMLEWYKTGINHHALMDDVEAFFRFVGAADKQPCERFTFREIFLRFANIDPLVLDANALKQAAISQQISIPRNIDSADNDDPNFWMDLFMSDRIAPQLGLNQPCFIYDFPTSMAALSKINGSVAERFEVFWKGIEIANGFHELADPAEQRQRFQAEQAWRQATGRVVRPFDANLIAALEQGGLPPCAGVAVGVDRLLMLMLGLPNVASVLAFDWQRA